MCNSRLFKSAFSERCATPVSAFGPYDESATLEIGRRVKISELRGLQTTGAEGDTGEGDLASSQSLALKRGASLTVNCSQSAEFKTTWLQEVAERQKSIK